MVRCRPLSAEVQLIRTYIKLIYVGLKVEKVALGQVQVCLEYFGFPYHDYSISAPYSFSHVSLTLYCIILAIACVVK